MLPECVTGQIDTVSSSGYGQMRLDKGNNIFALTGQRETPPPLPPHAQTHTHAHTRLSSVKLPTPLAYFVVKNKEQFELPSEKIMVTDSILSVIISKWRVIIDRCV